MGMDESNIEIVPRLLIVGVGMQRYDVLDRTLSISGRQEVILLPSIDS